jgi:branched-subunit amino acid aminotransferase/4-amino-4-deoxychorismate lyase
VSGPGSRRPDPPGRALWIDGRLRHGEEAVLSLFDRGARDGEGLFETLRVQGGRPVQWERHLERLVLSAAELGFPVPPSLATLERAVAEVLRAGHLEEAAVRITVTRGVPGGRPTRPGVWVEAEPLRARLWRGARRGAATAILSKRPFEPGTLGRHKTTSRIAYHLAREEARSRGADEALLTSGAGEILEGAVSNVFAVLGGRVATPPLERGILPGIVRETVIRLGATAGIAIEERAVTRDEAALADEVFLTNSIQGVVPLVELEERRLPSRVVGDRLRDVYEAAVERACRARGAAV